MDFDTFMSNPPQVELYDGRDPLFELFAALDLENYFSKEPETDGRDGTEGYEPDYSGYFRGGE